MSHIDVQQNQTPTQMISRQFQSSSKQNAGGPTQPPPSSSSSGHFLWIGAAAAIILGGGAYVLSNSKSEDIAKVDGNSPKKSEAPKKRKYHFRN